MVPCLQVSAGQISSSAASFSVAPLRSSDALSAKSMPSRRTQFVWTIGQQEFYQMKGYPNVPSRCKNCSLARKSNVDPGAAAEIASRAAAAAYRNGDSDAAAAAAAAYVPPQGGHGGYGRGRGGGRGFGVRSKPY